ncbi:MAG: Succinate-semialdehyde dehydrogenase, partial [Akkermansiaceae bacterium]|nr:Succinate-semialdehyde dehydrogenase [Akkermansiaceae bacterium]
KAADLLEEQAGELAKTMAREMGKPVQQGRGEALKCANACRYYAGHAEAMLADETLAATDDGPRATIIHQPVGTVLAIMPWNFPLWQVFRFAAPALMAGNTAILKHASNVPRSARAIAEIIREASGRDDLLVPVFVSGRIAAELIGDPRIHAVTFTGSTGAGRKVAEAAGRHLKKSVLELGGSDPYLVLEDADPAKAAAICAAARMINGGQSCIAGKRFLVDRKVHDIFMELFAMELRNYPLGDPLAEETKLGPMAREDLRDELHAQVTASVAAGARLVMGGVIPDRAGAGYPATLLAEVTPGMRVFDEETFGPVAAVTLVDDLEEAIQLANLTPFGLGSAVISGSHEKAVEIARRLQSGTVAINSQVVSDPRLPFGGVKESGWGRELGAHGIREFVQVKTIAG